jgi:hypothetical protein
MPTLMPLVAAHALIASTLNVVAASHLAAWAVIGVRTWGDGHI